MPNIAQEVELSAWYWGPTTYTKALTFGNFFEVPTDPNQSFVPVHQVRANPQLFIVGLLPPSVEVTGKVLDRSGTFQRKSGAVETPPLSNFSANSQQKPLADTKNLKGKDAIGGIVSKPGYTIQPGTGKTAGDFSGGGPPGPDQGKAVTYSLSTAQLWGNIYAAYKKVYGREPTATEMQLYTAQALRETSGKLPNNNFGYVGNYKTPPPGVKTFLHTDGAYYNSYDSALDGAVHFVRTLQANGNVGVAARSGDTLGYMTSLAQNNYFTAPVEDYYSGGTAQKGPKGTYQALLGQVAKSMRGYGVQLETAEGLQRHAPDGLAYREDQLAYRNRIDPNWQKKNVLNEANMNRFRVGSPYKAGDLGPGSDTGGSPSWENAGSSKAKESKKQTLKGGANLDYAMEQTREALQTARLIEAMREVPPLRLLVNPSSFKIGYEKIISDDWGRDGPIIQHFGENQDTLEGSGRVAAFFATTTNLNEGPGLTRTGRQYSAGYQNFMSLYMLYRSNASLYTTGLEKAKKQNLSLIGSVYIYYANTIYIGSFTNFSITETGDSPHSLEYSFSFQVRATFALTK